MEIKSTTLQLRIRGIGYREQQLSLSDRLGIINKRLNNRNPIRQVRLDDTLSNYPFEQMRTIHHSNIDIIKLRRGALIPPDSALWISKEFGAGYLDLEISNLPPKNDDLTEAVLISLVKERLAGLITVIPLALDHDQLEIGILEGAIGIVSQTSLRDKQLENIYTEGCAISSKFDLPPILESDIEHLLDDGWFNDTHQMDTSSPLQKFWAALAILSPLERDIISSRYKIGAEFQTREALAVKHGATRERIAQREAKIMRYFRNLNRFRNTAFDKTGIK